MSLSRPGQISAAPKTRSSSFSRKQLLVLTGVAMLVFDVALIFFDQKMKDAGGPSILGFEFAGNERQAVQAISEWGGSGRSYARWSLWIDYGFMVSYGVFFTLAALATRDFARQNGLRALTAVGAVAPVCAGAAAVFDAGENVFLLLALGGHGGSLAPLAATACASAKFLLIAVAMIYVLWGLTSRFRRRRWASEPA